MKDMAHRDEPIPELTGSDLVWIVVAAVIVVALLWALASLGIIAFGDPA